MNEVERNVLQMLLAGDDARLKVLRHQLKVAEVLERDFSGAGFFTTLRVHASAPRLEGHPRLIIGDVQAELTGLIQPVGFLLFVNDGALDFLECFAGGEWPASPPTILRTYYVHAREGEFDLYETPERDLRWAFKGS